ncbi:MAG: TMEM175 family protein, partial [Candidatus Omnitrophica bacterium]|nr:TMEM175 family protein [Candidatus Omnitrophota bacterium]
MSELFKTDKFIKEADYHIMLAGLWNDFVSYAISFMLLGVLWLAHHWQFQFITYIDPPLVFINIIWFMFICLIPFSTMMLSDHPNFFAPVIVFECNILIVFLILYAQWAYVTKRKHLAGSSLDAKTVSQQRNVA